jgi:hypothetical protein
MRELAPMPSFWHNSLRRSQLDLKDRVLSVKRPVTVLSDLNTCVMAIVLPSGDTIWGLQRGHRRRWSYIVIILKYKWRMSSTRFLFPPNHSPQSQLLLSGLCMGFLTLRQAFTLKMRIAMLSEMEHIQHNVAIARKPMLCNKFWLRNQTENKNLPVVLCWNESWSLTLWKKTVWGWLRTGSRGEYRNREKGCNWRLEKIAWWVTWWVILFTTYY